MSRRGARGSRRGTVLAAALVGVAVGAETAGCSTNDETEPQSQESESGSTPTPSETDAANARDLQPELDEPYVQVVLDYYDAWYAALGTGDTEYKRVDKPGAEPVTGSARDIVEQVSLVREGDEQLISEITSTEPKGQVLPSLTTGTSVTEIRPRSGEPASYALDVVGSATVRRTDNRTAEGQ